jgi:hypothetical protein
MEDLIELMVCKNCKNFDRTNSCCLVRHPPHSSLEYEKTNFGASCSLWEETLDKNELVEVYSLINEVLKEFVDTSEENYTILSLWILGTWFHSYFESYPYLFINAMKGSGKTRLLKLIKELSCNGDMLASLTDAVLFRTTGTLCIDEFESVGSKEKSSLRELLNTAYKKGGKVKRVRKKKTLNGEEQIIDEFLTYRPIAIANIWGMDEVIADRCFSIILEKSTNKITTRKVENFSTNQKIIKIKEKLGLLLGISSEKCCLCYVVSSQNIYTDWNTYIDNNNTNNTNTPNNTNNTKQHTFFDKIWNSEINGRNLELSFALLELAEDIGIFNKTLEVITKLISGKKEEDIYEGRDVMFFDFVSKMEEKEWYKIKELTYHFRESIEYDEEDKWLNEKWMGRALKRLLLLLDSKRTSQGREVVLNIQKAQEKIKMFK